MKLLVLRALWGMTGTPREQVERIAAAGYDGVEGWPEGVDRREFRSMLADNNLRLINGIHADNADDWGRQLLDVLEDRPMKVVAFTGRDSMSRDEGCRLFEACLRAQEEAGVEVAHETHRGRLFFTPWDTAFYLQRFPSLRINADFSHWVCVLERLPDDCAHEMAMACERAVHIHGRVGHEEGPQVPDPADPIWERQLHWHEMQWDRIRAALLASGRQEMTFTPEFGAPNYMWTSPHTHEPVADLWDVCLWMAKRIRSRWADPA